MTSPATASPTSSPGSARPGLATVSRLVPLMPSAPETVPLAAVQGALALDLGTTRLPSAPRPDLAVASDEAPEDVRLKAWAGRFAQAAVEAAAGHRPLTQLVRWTSPEVYRQLDQRRRLLAVGSAAAQRRTTTRPQVRSVRLSRPTAEVAEVSVHVRAGQRSRALAARLDRVSDRWVCTALVLG